MGKSFKIHPLNPKMVKKSKKSAGVLSKTKERQFSQKYFQSKTPGAYGGKRTFLSQFSKKDKTTAEKWLEQQQSYALHKPFQKNFRRRKTIANFEEQLQADLIDLVHIASDNSKNRYLLTVIDVFSKYAAVEILRKKDSKSVALAFEKILNRLSFTPRYLNTDNGTEFLGSPFQALLKQRGIKFFSSKDSTIKCAIIERFNRSLMNKLFRLFTKQNSYRYIEDLANIVENYNGTRHSVTGLAPIEINHNNKEIVWLRIFNSKKLPKITLKTKKLKVGAFVRIAKRIKTFDKGYKGRWSGEIFKIREIKQTNPLTYNLVDLQGENITGGFYEQELNPTSLPKTFAVQSILDTKKDKILVKWLDYPTKFNTWVPKNYLLKNI